jgi:hypothetical protein
LPPKVNPNLWEACFSFILTEGCPSFTFQGVKNEVCSRTSGGMDKAGLRIVKYVKKWTRRPAKTAFMEYREQQWEKAGHHRRIRLAWVPLSGISPYAVKAVISAESHRQGDEKIICQHQSM